MALRDFIVMSMHAALQTHIWALLKVGLASCWRARALPVDDASVCARGGQLPRSGPGGSESEGFNVDAAHPSLEGGGVRSEGFRYSRFILTTIGAINCLHKAVCKCFAGNSLDDARCTASSSSMRGRRRCATVQNDLPTHIAASQRGYP